MPFFKLTDSEIREVARKHIESLEFWLRRIINDSLTSAYGKDYWSYHNDKGLFLLKQEIRSKVSERVSAEPDRYPRWIDATLIEHQVFIICKEDLYSNFFKPYFETEFRFGRVYLKSVFDTLIKIRNKVSHANPTSIRDAEKAICYSNDLIDSIKKYYSDHNMNQDFNVPTILSYSDSFGNKIYAEEWAKNSMNINLNGKIPKLRPGDRIRMSLEIDSSFNPDEYKIEWQTNIKTRATGASIEFLFLDEDVDANLILRVHVKSNKSWHKHGLFDDYLSLCMTILPPLS
jgi:hypothetical protein